MGGTEKECDTKEGDEEYGLESEIYNGYHSPSDEDSENAEGHIA